MPRWEPYGSNWSTSGGDSGEWHGHRSQSAGAAWAGSAGWDSADAAWAGSAGWDSAGAAWAGSAGCNSASAVDGAGDVDGAGVAVTSGALAWVAQLEQKLRKYRETNDRLRTALARVTDEMHRRLDESERVFVRLSDQTMEISRWVFFWEGFYSCCCWIN